VTSASELSDIFRQEGRVASDDHVRELDNVCTSIERSLFLHI